MKIKTILLAGLLSVFSLQHSAFGMPHYELAYRLSGTGGMMIKDDKVDQWIGRPVLGGEFAVEFLPTGRWHCLQEWNNASIGVGASYLNLGNDKVLGSAVTASGYINMPFYNGKHFRIGARPTVGLAAVTKTYANTLPDGYQLYEAARGADGKLLGNWSIGSILNAYLALQLYMDFPVKDGWEITLNGGWHHISNGSVMHPNGGYNMAMAAVGVRYQPNVRRDDVQSTKPDVPRKLYDGVEKPWAVEISATGAVRQNYYRDNYPKMQFFGAASVKIAAYWVPVSIFRIGLGADAFYDGYYASVSNSISGAKEAYPDAPVTYFGKTYLKESNPTNCFRAGISLQPEFIIGKLTAGIHVGFYVFDPVKNLEPFAEAQAADQAGTPLNRGVFYSYDFTKASNYQDGWCYMQFVIKYHVLDHLFVQLGLKTHGVRAEFIDAGIGVAF
ncbi:MAG: acyloxyacyl hydrolase [Paludibacteraceae bacterium]|nr:acyloxyacyl hydrolase [Paludibacteraceae bacterium]